MVQLSHGVAGEGGLLEVEGGRGGVSRGSRAVGKEQAQIDVRHGQAVLRRAAVPLGRPRRVAGHASPPFVEQGEVVLRFGQPRGRGRLVELDGPLQLAFATQRQQPGQRVPRPGQPAIGGAPIPQAGPVGVLGPVELAVFIGERQVVLRRRIARLRGPRGESRRSRRVGLHAQALGMHARESGRGRGQALLDGTGVPSGGRGVIRAAQQAGFEQQAERELEIDVAGAGRGQPQVMGRAGVAGLERRPAAPIVGRQRPRQEAEQAGQQAKARKRRRGRASAPAPRRKARERAAERA